MKARRVKTSGVPRSASEPRLSAAVRIRAKRLRYALGPLKDWPEAAEVVRMLKERQDLLGELHDRHAFALVLERMLAQAPAPQLQVGLDALMQKAHAEGHELYLQYGQHRHQSDVRLAALLDLMSERLGKRLGLHVEVVPQGD